MKSTIKASLAALALTAALPAAASAHAALEGTFPANGSTVSSSVKTITVRFDEAVLTGTLSVKTASGTAVPVSVRQKGAKITGTLGRKLTAGRYRVTWRARADDGHRETGSFSFRVR